MTDPTAELAGTLGKAAASVATGGVSAVPDVLLAMFRLALTPIGQEVLAKMFAEHGLTLDAIEIAVKKEVRF